MAQESGFPVKTEIPLKPKPLKVIITQFGDLILLSAIPVTKTQDEEDDFDDEGFEQPSEEKRVYVEGSTFPDYKITESEEAELPYGVFACVFRVVAYGDIPKHGDEKLHRDAVESLKQQAEGKIVTFGSTILLQHFVTGYNLAISKKIGSVFGTQKMEMTQQVLNSSVITLRPASKYQPQKSEVTYSSTVILSFERMPTHIQIQVGSFDDEPYILAGPKASPLTIHPFDSEPKATKLVKIGAPCHLQVKGLGYYIGATHDHHAWLVDAKDSSTIWILLNEQINTGGFVDAKKYYYFFNLQTGMFMGNDFSLQEDMEDAGLFTLESLSSMDKPLAFKDEARMVSKDRKVFGVAQDTDVSLCLKSLYPKSTGAESRDMFPISADNMEDLHKLHTYYVLPLEESASQMMLLSGLRLSLKNNTEWLDEDFKTIIQNMKEDDEDCNDFINDTQTLRQIPEALMKEHSQASFQEKGIYSKLKLPASLFSTAQKLLDFKKTANEQIKDASDFNKAKLKNLLEEVENAYQSTCKALIQMMKIDPSACSQLPEIETSIINADSTYLPTIIKLSQTRKIESSEAAVKSFLGWLKEMETISETNIVEQEVVLYSLSRLLPEFLEGDLPQLEAALRAQQVGARKYTFVKSGNSVFVNFNPPVEGIPRMDGALKSESLQKGSYPEFTAGLLRFYECCYRVFSPAVAADIFQEVGISQEVMEAIVRSDTYPLLVRAAALHFVSSYLPPPVIESGFKKSKVYTADDMHRFALDFDAIKNDSSASQFASLLLYVLSLKSFASNEKLENKLILAREAFKFAKTMLRTKAEPLVFVQIIERVAVWALLGYLNLSEPEVASNWFYECIKEVVNNKDPPSEMGVLLNALLAEVFEVLICTLDIKDEVFLKLLLNHCVSANWAVTDADLARVEGLLEGWQPNPTSQLFTKFQELIEHMPSITLLKQAVMYSQISSLKTSFELNDDRYQLLIRVFNPRMKALQSLDEVVFLAKNSEALERLKDVVRLDPSEARLAASIGFVPQGELAQAVTSLCSFIGKKICILENPSLQRFAQTVSLKENTYMTFVKMWTHLEKRLEAEGEDKILLARLASYLFSYFYAFTKGNSHCKKAILEHLKQPFSDIAKSNLEIVEIGLLIRELNDFTDITTDKALIFFSYLHERSKKQSLYKTGAYRWISALVANSDESMKPDLQSAAYSAIREELASVQAKDETGTCAMLINQATICAIENRPVRLQLQLELPVDEILTLVNASDEADMAEAALLMLARVHSIVSPEKRKQDTESTIAVMQKILEIAKTLLTKEEEIASFVQLGLYEHVKSLENPTVSSWIFTKEQFAILSLLRLLSSGKSPEPLGGLANNVVAVLKLLNLEKTEWTPKVTKLTTDYGDFFKESQVFIGKVKTATLGKCDFALLEQSIAKTLADQLFTGKKIEKATEKSEKPAKPTMLLAGLGTKVEKTEKPTMLLAGFGAKVVKPVEVSVSVPSSTDPSILSFKFATVPAFKSLQSSDSSITNVKQVFKSILSIHGLLLPPSEPEFLTMFKDITNLFKSLPSRENLFPTLKALMSFFNHETFSKVAYLEVFKFWVGQMIHSSEMDELIDGVDFYNNFGDQNKPERYEILMDVFNYDQQGSRLLAKIRKALIIELEIRKQARKSAGKSHAHIIRKMRPGRCVSGSDISGLIDQHSKLITAYINWLQTICDNCNIQMQNFIRCQKSDQDIDIVSEVVSFCSNLLDITVKSTVVEENREMVLTAMKAIADFCTGPCVENQALVGKDVKLFLSINAIFKLKYDRKFLKELDKYVAIRKETLHLLQTLLEGNASEDMLQTFTTFLVTDTMVTYTTDVYLNIIVPNKKTIEMGDFFGDPRYEIVEYAMEASLFLIQYQNLSKTSIHEMIKRDEDIRAFKEFYLQYCGYVEIYKPMGDSKDLEDINNLWGVSFRIPFMCKHLTEESAAALIVDVSHASKQEKLTGFMDQVKPLQQEMRHQLMLKHSRCLYEFTTRWQLYKDLSLTLVILINIYLLARFDSVRGLKTDDMYEMIAIVGCGALQTFLYLIGYICNVVERYSMILSAYSQPESEDIEMDQFYGLPDHESQKYKHIEEPKEAKSEEACGCMAVLLYQATWITAGYLLLSVGAIYYPLLGPLLLLTLAERKAEIQNILKSVTLNKKQLLLSAALGLILLYVFSVFSFLFFGNFYKKENGITCETMWECLLTTVNIGLRGGLADTMGSSEDDSYWPRYAFDLLFHILILILMLNVIFGIIIDTFGKLRDERTALYEDINNVCYVCGTNRNKIELGGKGWSYHFQVEHSPFAYLAYLVRLESMNEDELNGIEKYVRKLYREKDSSFFPSTSRHLVQTLKSD